MLGETIRQKLHEGERVYGTHVCSLTNPVTAQMQSTLEYDFVFICNEHMPIDHTETSMLCQFYAAKGVSPIVRIPAPVPHYAARALDEGAQGIVAPYVETVEEVKALVGAVKYRPIKGEKLKGFLSGATQPSEKLAAFFDRFNRHNFLIIGIESYPAYERLEELITIPGVDGVFVGPHDLTCSMDIPEEYEHPEFRRVLEDIIVRCERTGVGVGVHMSQLSTSLEGYLELIQKGMNYVLFGSDVGVLMKGMGDGLRTFREAMGDSFVAGTEETNRPVASCLTTMARQGAEG